MTEPLGALAEDVRNSLGARLGIKVGNGPFQAHVTLGRVREKKEGGPAVRFLEKENDLLRGEFRGKTMVLFESILGPAGACYMERASFSLPG